ncbi:MAG: MBL fold metallo-hydrolase [Bacilli bacterium]|nr:MBL fold metallo-hydrolase [Bacilli bacterium]
MKIDKLILGDFRTNCYVVSHNNTAFVIDPASDGETIDAYLRKNKYQLKAIFLTHGNQDHIGAVDYLYSLYKCQIIAHLKEKDIITGNVPSKVLQIPSLKGIKINSPIKYFNGEFTTWDIDGVIVDGILTPGHTEGSVTYVLRNYYRIFSGDTVFKGSVGRTDFPTSNRIDLKKSIDLYKTFKDECKIHPGHGESTTIANEKANNEFFKY